MRISKGMLLIILMLLLFLLLAAGCTPSSSADWVPYMSSTGAFGEQGYYYLSSSECLYFLDVDKGINVCLCSKVGCPHDTTVNTDPAAIFNCEAYISGSLVHEFPFFFLDGGLFYILSDDYGMHLVRRNADGSGLRQIGTFCKPYIEARKTIDVQSYICAGGYLYYCADICGLIDSDIVTEACVLRRMDLRSGKEEELLSVPGYEYVSLCAAKGNGMLYLHYLLPERTGSPDDNEKRQTSPVRLMLWEEGTSKDTVLLEETFGEELNYKTIIDGALLYTTKEGDSFVTRSFNLNTKEDKKFSDVTCLTYLTEEYARRRNPETKKVGIYNIATDTFLDNDFEQCSLAFLNINGKKLILSRRIPSPDNPTVIEKEIYFYVDIDALADGLQEEDVVDFYILHMS